MGRTARLVIPGNGTVPWDFTGEASRDEVAAYAERVGVPLDVPQGARDLGCHNCRQSDRLRWPQLGMVYCATCPVEQRRRQ